MNLRRNIWRLVVVCTVVSIWGSRVDAAGPQVKLTVEDNAAVNMITIAPGEPTRIDIHVTALDPILDLFNMTLRASASGVLSITDLAYKNGW